MHALYIIPDIEHDTGENIDDERETDGQERGVDEEKANLVDGYVKALAKVSTYPERVAFKEG